MPVQLDFIIRVLTESVQRDATLMEQQPYKAILTHDRSFFEAVVVEQQSDAVMALEQELARTWLDKTPDEFEAEGFLHVAGDSDTFSTGGGSIRRRAIRGRPMPSSNGCRDFERLLPTASRRGFLQAGGLAALGLGLPGLLRAEAGARRR